MQLFKNPDSAIAKEVRKLCADVKADLHKKAVAWAVKTITALAVLAFNKIRGKVTGYISNQ